MNNDMVLLMSAYMRTPGPFKAMATMVGGHLQAWHRMSEAEINTLEPSLESMVVDNLLQVVHGMSDNLLRDIEEVEFLQTLVGLHSWHQLIWHNSNLVNIIFPNVLAANGLFRYDYEAELRFRFASVKFFCDLIRKEPTVRTRFLETLEVLARPANKGDIGMRTYCAFVSRVLRHGQSQRSTKLAYQQARAFNQRFPSRLAEIEAYWRGETQEKICMRALSWQEAVNGLMQESSIRAFQAALRWN